MANDEQFNFMKLSSQNLANARFGSQSVFPQAEKSIMAEKPTDKFRRLARVASTKNSLGDVVITALQAEGRDGKAMTARKSVGSDLEMVGTRTSRHSTGWAKVRSQTRPRAYANSQPSHDISHVATTVLKRLRESRETNPEAYQQLKSMLFSDDPGERSRAETTLLGRSKSTVPRPLFPRPERLTDFEEIIFSRKGYDVFMHFLQSEYSSENLLFWKALQDLRAMWPRLREGECSVMDIRAQAQEVYLYFVVPSATQQVNLAGRTVAQFSQAVTNPDPATFLQFLFRVTQDAQREVVKLMDTDSFRRFMLTRSTGFAHVMRHAHRFMHTQVN